MSCWLFVEVVGEIGVDVDQEIPKSRRQEGRSGESKL
jgi:hypothetical protein